jgi:ribonuclease VapC
LTGVLDASAVLVVYFNEPGWETVLPMVEGAFVSAVNYSEVVAKALDRGDAFDAVLRKLSRMAVLVIPHDEILARRAGELRLVTRKFGLSVGDRACLALAERERLPAFTTDRSWANLDVGVDIRLIR